MFHVSFHYQHQIQRVLIVGALAMLVALLVTWTTQTTRSHADDYNTAADEATRDFRQMESQRQAVADLQAQTRNQAQ